MKNKERKFIDQKSKTSLFDALRKDKSKIIYKYIKDVIIDDDKTYKRITKSQFGFMTQEEKERKSFGKFKGLIRITGQAHVDEYNIFNSFL